MEFRIKDEQDQTSMILSYDIDKEEFELKSNGRLQGETFGEEEARAIAESILEVLGT